MGELHTRAKKNYWATISPEEKSAIFSARAKKMWASKSKEERQARANLMVKAKKDKLSTS